jgi:hypothetical protein
MHAFRARSGASLLLTLALALPAAAAVAPRSVPTLVRRDTSEVFPNTAVGQTSLISCLGLCYKLATSPDGSCDGSGPESLEKGLAAPFSAGNYRLGTAGTCGGAPVSLPVTLAPGQALWLDARFSPTRPGSFSDTLRISGFTFDFSGTTTGTAGPCVPSATTLCVAGNRFAVTARWTTGDGGSGDGQAVQLTPDTGYFWFFSAANVEMVLKVLDACSLNQRFWVFAGGLTDVKVDLTVRDTATGAQKVYHNPQGAPFQPIEDTAAFACAGSSHSMQRNAGTPTGTALPLGQGRFQVTATWRTGNGQSGSGQAVQLTDETGYFWFFSPDNVEMLVKVLDACSLNQRFWVFAGGLTNVQVDLTVRDTAAGTFKTYHNPQGTPFQPIEDTGAFATCGAGSGLPPDPGAAGKATLGGVDSNGDGVRDDLERYIALTYGGSPATVDALRRTAKAVQGAILDSASTNASIDHATDLARSVECLEAVRPADAIEVHERLVAQALDTEARGLAYLAANDQLGGTVYPLAPPSQWAGSCDSATAADLRASGLAVRSGLVCQQPATATVFFGNGVWNTCEQAHGSTSVLALGVTPLLSPDEQSGIGFATACNPTRGHIQDLWRATKQSFQSDFSSFYRALANVDPMPQSLKQAFLADAASVTESAVSGDPALAAQVATYENLLFEGQKVVVAAHSQGNFYANLASTALTAEEQASFGIVSVANPDDHVEGGWDYTTLVEDLVIGAVPGALPANLANGLLPNLHDLTGHTFVTSYMAAGSRSRDRIVHQVHDELEALPSPPDQAGIGVITITLTWDGETDVDLHVFEPDGTHVYYVDKIGDSGYLDVDNIEGFGPEHYYVACDTVQAGTYRVGVNYYRGDAPERAHVQIAAGLVSKSFDLTLPAALGSDGNGDPQPVATIVVGGSAATGYTFDVQPAF